MFNRRKNMSNDQGPGSPRSRRNLSFPPGPGLWSCHRGNSGHATWVSLTSCPLSSPPSCRPVFPLVMRRFLSCHSRRFSAGIQCLSFLSLHSCALVWENSSGFPIENVGNDGTEPLTSSVIPAGFQRESSVFFSCPFLHVALLGKTSGFPIKNVGNDGTEPLAPSVIPAGFQRESSVFLFCPFIRVPSFGKTPLDSRLKMSGMTGRNRLLPLSFPQVFSGNPVSFFLVPSFM